MPHLSLPLPDLAATERLASSLAGLVKRGDVIGLQGSLGAGKTAFARAFIHALGVRDDVPSPTFTLVQSYTTPAFTLHHFDLYRLKHENELEELGWDDIRAGVTLVEWPERAGGQLPHEALFLHFDMDKDMKRVCRIEVQDAWAERLKGFS